MVNYSMKKHLLYIKIKEKIFYSINLTLFHITLQVISWSATYAPPCILVNYYWTFCFLEREETRSFELPCRSIIFGRAFTRSHFLYQSYGIFMSVSDIQIARLRYKEN